MKNSDVLIVGGGPSGLRLAARLAGSGLHVRVLEKKDDIGSRVVCTGIIGKEVFDSFGLDRDSALGELQSVRLVSPFGTSVVYRHPEPFAYVVDRERFDRNLASDARDRGADIELSTRAEDIQISGDGVRIRASDSGGSRRLYSARMTVLASGIDFGLHAKLGLGRPKEYLNGAQVEIETDTPAAAAIFVGRDIAPGAFAWMVPSGPSRLRVGLLTRREPQAYLARLVGAAFPERFADAAPPGIRIKAIAQGLLSKTYGERVIAIGEAAGHVKTTTGGGVAYGLVGADIAAEVIGESFAKNAFAARDLAWYETAWRAAMQKEIVLGRMVRRVCARLSDAQMERIFYLAQTDGIIPIIREKGDFDWHGDLILALVKRLSFMKVFRGMPQVRP
ncbi:MAG TPA: NAD(P)/FAD-dependent oxidoreductase [Acidobacteriota bacterium]|nr:NAD(P)/FAD-dependent oxidoreductase [Acidobacteriota bacterium]